MQLQKLVGAVAAVSFALFLAPAPTEAKGGHGQGGGAVKPAKTAKPQTKVTARAHVSHGKGSTQRMGKATQPKTKSTTQRMAKSTQTTKGSQKTRTASVDKGQALDKGKTHKRTASTDARTDSVPGSDLPSDPLTLNKAQQKLTQNTNLRAKIESRLPVGTDVIAAAAGFRNLGQFVAAVNVAYNHGISFDALRLRMTGPDAVSLGQALQQVKGLNSAVANTTAQTALAQAEADIEATTTTTTKKAAKRRS